MSAPYYDDGDVTLWHGDALDERGWLAADVLVTDPPYGVGYWSGRTDRPGFRATVEGDQDTSLRDDVLDLWGDRPALVFGSWRAPRPARTSALIVWDKRGGAGFSGDTSIPWAGITEEVYVLGRDGWQGARRPAIYSIPTIPPAHRLNHPTPKPVRLMAELLACCPDGVVADPFAGSGSTLVAAREQGRRAVGVEIDERYCEIIARRLQQQAFVFEDLDA